MTTSNADPAYRLENGNWVKGYGNYRKFNPIWAMYDIYYADTDENGELAGTLYLAASDPIPVGDEPIDKASFLQSWFVGRRLARMWNKPKEDV